MPPSFVHRITKYDPADRDGHGHYTGAEDPFSDHGPVEAAYLAAITAFAEASGIERPTAMELVRVMLRDQGAWCLLEAGEVFTVHVGWDQYVYVGSDLPCAEAVARTRELGLFPEPMPTSPYAADLAETETAEAADEGFWSRVRAELASRQTVLLEEGFVLNAARWHRLTLENLAAVRADLAPRALLTVWPDLDPDVGAVLAGLPREGSVEFLWEAADGSIVHAFVDDTEFPQLAALVAGARAACALPLDLDGRHPLLCAALPDSDGVLRARW
ncbi:RNA-binding protein [Streptomyces showdoensis]|uniref:RNA-binding protein n=1 Tax=Streptomyces showdoensis TaxID=68268 RepID=A0A2P2GU90_STREW|nr:RNA-binding protein [Streptomyces showdoensis]KKZ75058.1 RNA-binding protein [Streptomyces showdoensis]